MDRCSSARPGTTCHTGDHMNDVTEVTGLPPGVAEALAFGTLGDPFAVLGPHDTATGRIIRAFLPGAQGVEVLARSGDKLLGGSRQPCRTGCSRVASAAANRIGCVSPGRGRCRKPRIHIPSGRCSANSICICSTKAGISNWRRISAPMWQPSMASPACASRSGRQMRAPSPWSVISTPGTRGGIQCGCAFPPACGNCSSRVSVRARGTSTPHRRS